MKPQTFLITGSTGCIGAWVLRNLVSEMRSGGDIRVVATDLDTNPLRPSLLLSADELDQITWERLDVTDLDAVKELVGRHHVTHIIHLAGLQVPFCRANPSLGAHVNVVGTVNLFEAARHAGVAGLAYASSIAVLGPAPIYGAGPVGDDAPPSPETLYGVYKVANEGTARRYWVDWGVGSVGLRPYIVYGVGRDQGMTSDLTKAIVAAAAGQPYHIRFGGEIALQHANDVAQIFIASARAQHHGAAACNLRNDVIQVSEFVAALKAIRPTADITFEADSPLPFPANLDDSGLRSVLGSIPHTPLQDAIRKELERFEALLAQGKLDPTSA